MESLLHLLADLRRRDVKLWLESDKLRYSAPKDALSTAMVDQLRANKEEIIAFLLGNAAAAALPHKIEAWTAAHGHPIPLSSSQQRPGFLEQLEGRTAVYNRPMAWLRPLAPAPRATTRVIAFPHGGGSPTGFLPWRGHLPDSLAAFVVQLPGRWERLNEPAHTRLDPLLDALLAGLLPTLAPPFVLFGVSMGALVAFELARALVRSGGPLPSLLVVAAYPAPHLPNPLHAHRDSLRLALGDPPDTAALARHGLVPDGLLDPDALRLVLPALRADIELVLHHEHRPGPPLPLPILVLGGLADPLVTRAQLDAWVEHTAADFAVQQLPGGHLFYRTHPDATLRALSRALSSHGAPP